MERDLSAISQSHVRVKLASPSAAVAAGIGSFPGSCIDEAAVTCVDYEVNPSLLYCATGPVVREGLYTDLFRSRCPVTGQPDFGSVLVRYRGTPIDRRALLRYLVSYRDHNDFHESCIERIFVDLQLHCAPEELTVYGRFNRRGGLDINPYRSDSEDPLDNVRLWRQ